MSNDKSYILLGDKGIKIGSAKKDLGVHACNYGSSNILKFCSQFSI